jgi:ectoine hydroxylase-related dioxygenase (phytanoyl-CoA dioxygenase family)
MVTNAKTNLLTVDNTVADVVLRAYTNYINSKVGAEITDISHQELAANINEYINQLYEDRAVSEYTIVCNQTNNNDRTISNGELVVDIFYTRPAVINQPTKIRCDRRGITTFGQ